MMRRCLVAVTMGSLHLLGTRAARAEDACFLAAMQEAKTHLASVPTAIYWAARTKQRYVLGNAKTVGTGNLAFYLSGGSETAKSSELALPDGIAMPEGLVPDASGPHQVPATLQCPKLFMWELSKKPATKAIDVQACLASITTPDAIIKEYRNPQCQAQFVANSASSVAGEAAQILGQIVVDRASQAAYTLLDDKLQTWLGCTKPSTWFPATCKVLQTLRLQDLAMAPDQLRSALAADGIAIVKRKFGKAPAKQASLGPPALHAVFAADTGGSPDDILATINAAIEHRIVPDLARPIATLTGHSAEVTVRQLVDKGLKLVETAGENALCKQKDRDHVLALAASAFAACELKSASSCSPMQVVQQFEASCPPNTISSDQLAYAESIAGHLWDALSLKQDTVTPDPAKRLTAAVDGAFEIACMYAVTSPSGPYVCELVAVDDKQERAPLSPAEEVAIARDVMHAAANRDGGALTAAIVAALVRVLPPATDKSQERALRVLATIAAYAATYTTAGTTADDAHKRRTALLESLTQDMTSRADRGGDWIASIGGSLRGLVGRRYSHNETDASGNVSRADSFWGPASLPLGFGLDYLCKKAHHGLHVELSVLDLGQYLKWDGGGKVVTPELIDVFAPSATVGFTFAGREIPFFIGVTAGYSPNFDFDPASATDKRGAWNVGATVGAFVPLFDFN